MKRLACLLIAVSTACGGSPAVYDAVPQHASRAFALPKPVPATPIYRAELDRSIAARRIGRLEKMHGVAIAALVVVHRVKVAGGGTTGKLRVGVVDALEFRSVAPLSTRNAEFVWTSLLAGRAVPTFAAARRLGLEGDDTIRLAGGDPISVGAFADNGAPNHADVIVDQAIAANVAAGGQRSLVIGARSGATVESVRRNVKRVLPGARLVKLTPDPPRAPQVPTPIATAGGGVIGTMAFRILKGGLIAPDPAWVAANIVTQPVPILGAVTCHRLLFRQLAAALSEIARRGLTDLIDTSDYGGCYVPRFVDRNPNKPLSMHAFGLAVDLNVSQNALGTRGNMDPRVVALFEKWGFAWGGRWARPDPMHFELARLLRV